jgi:transposase
MRPAEKGDSAASDRTIAWGVSTTIHIAVDALGNVLRLLYTAGQVHESTKAEALIAGLHAENAISDKASDSDRFRAHLATRSIATVMPPNGSRSRAIPYDHHLYKERHLHRTFHQQNKALPAYGNRSLNR